MSIPFSGPSQSYVQPPLPWVITIEIRADSFDMLKHEVGNVAKHVARAAVPAHVAISGAGGSGSYNQVEYTVRLSTPLEAEIEEAEKRLADLRQRLGNEKR